MLDLSGYLQGKSPRRNAGSFWQECALEAATALGETSEAQKDRYMGLFSRNRDMAGTYLDWAKDIAGNGSARNPAAVFWSKARKPVDKYSLPSTERSV